jgi:hypothetical protein
MDPQFLKRLEVLTKILTFVSLVAAFLFTLSIQASLSAEPVFERPQVALAADTSALLGRAEHALLQRSARQVITRRFRRH